MKKFLALILALVMVMGLVVSVSAQTVGTDAADKAQITIQNASKGETYKVYKLFGATVTGTEGGSIAYSGEIPADLAAYFEQDTAENVLLKAGVNQEALFAALKTWAAGVTAAATATSDGSVLVFQGLDYGYYVVTSTQDSSTAITVTSTNPDATIYDKNGTAPGNLEKTVNDTDVNFGDTVTYTITFNTANFDGKDTNAKRIQSYTVTDTRANEFLADVTVTSVKVGDQEIKNADEVPQFVNNAMTIDWVDAQGNSMYDNGAAVTITYTAKITDAAAIAGDGNTNTAELTWNNGDVVDKNITGTATTNTYAFVLQKVDQNGNALQGATFQLPFYVKATNNGYAYAGTTAADGLTNTVTTPEDGVILVKGVASGTYQVTETVAPAGYNKLTGSVAVSVTATNEKTTNAVTYLDENGDKTDTQTDKSVVYNNDALAADVVVIVNKTGSALPSTGGMGTTLFYVIGGLMMLSAVVVLITKKRLA